MRTPMSRVRGLGSAREGTSHFVRQRLTALANVPLIIAFVLVLLAVQGAGLPGNRSKSSLLRSLR